MQKFLVPAAASLIGAAVLLHREQKRRWSRRNAPPAPDAALLATIDALVFDCDGVIYQHTTVLPGIPETLAALRAAGKRVFFVTNSANASREGLAKKLTKLGIAGVSPEHCITSAYAAAAYLSTHHPHVKRAYTVGGGGLLEELRIAGIEPLGEADTGGLDSLIAAGGLEPDMPIDAVVVGMLAENLCYSRLAKAAAFARDRSRPFVGTNPDASWPVDGLSALLPAGGCNVRYVSYAAEREPDVIVGKPSADLARLVAELHGLRPEATLMVGDRCNTDVAFGHSIGWRAMLVLTGCHGRDDVKDAADHEVPDYVASSVAVLKGCLLPSASS